MFVEALDSRFKNVCELDIIFHSDQVQYILAELIQGGLVLETALPLIRESAERHEKAARASSTADEQKGSGGAGAAGGAGSMSSSSFGGFLGKVKSKVAR